MKLKHINLILILFLLINSVSVFASSTSVLLSILLKKSRPSKICNYYNLIFTWHHVTNRSIIMVGKLNWNFPFLNWKKTIVLTLFYSDLWLTSYGIKVNFSYFGLLTKQLFYHLICFSSFSFSSKQRISDFFLLNPFPLISTFYNVLSSFF